MRAIVVGLGVQGRKRFRVAGPDAIGSVDPYVSDADFRAIKDVPVDSYDAAFVCVPDPAKLDVVVELVELGKHVLVEKPLIVESTSTLDALADLTRRRGVVCYTAYNHRFEPHFVRMKELLHSGRLGRVYLARLFYGNGTARDVRGSPWRDHGAGVLADLGSHLLDTVLFWFGVPREDFRLEAAHRFENRAFDHVRLAALAAPALELEASLLCWRNHFTADIYAERGSAHIESLCKWGPSTLRVRTRVLPSGKPPEDGQTLVQDDPTWQLEHAHFARLCREQAEGNLANDRWLSRTLVRLSREGAERFLA